MHVPDIGDTTDVEIIELHIAVGDVVAADDPVVTVESDKASMDIPAPAGGVVTAIRVAIGDRVGHGAVLFTYDPSPATAPSEEPAPEDPAPRSPGWSPAASADRRPPDITVETVVLGAGPGGYTAAFRAADLGQQVLIVDAGPTLGGVCLNVGCIPSKALLHAAKVIAETREMQTNGIHFPAPEVDLNQLRGWKNTIVARLTGGLAGLARQRKVTTISGTGRFLSDHELEVTPIGGPSQLIRFENAVIAVGSSPVRLPFVPSEDPRVLDSTGALDLTDIPPRLLILGGGIIGLEMATVYSELGSAITVVELMSQLIPGADPDLVKPLHRHLTRRYANIYLGTRVTAVRAEADGLHVSFDGPGAPTTEVFDKVLVAVGRTPNGRTLGAETAGIVVDDRGFVPVDAQMRTNVPHIYAIGDVVGQPMLAHKATHEAKVAAENIAGKKVVFDARVIPSVAYTDPEIAWVGLTEADAKKADLPYQQATFPWAASGRSLSLGREEGLTKLIFDPVSSRLLGCGIVGPSAGDLVAEAALAIEMGADATDLALTIHAHPTLSETIAMAAETFEGTITDLYVPTRARA